MFEKLKKMSVAFSMVAAYGSDDDMDMRRVQKTRKRILRVVVVAALMALLFHHHSYPEGSLIPRALIVGGMLVIAITIVGRTWVWTHMGKRRRYHFVSDGPYSVVRHPLYTLSIIGAGGIGAQSGSAVVTCLCLVAVWLLFDRLAQIEESDMASRFGEPYRKFIARTPRFVPDLRLWQAPSAVPIELRQFLRNFGDAMLFALAIPFFLSVDWAQKAGFLPVLFRLP